MERHDGGELCIALQSLHIYHFLLCRLGQLDFGYLFSDTYPPRLRRTNLKLGLSVAVLLLLYALTVSDIFVFLSFLLAYN